MIEMRGGRFLPRSIAALLVLVVPWQATLAKEARSAAVLHQFQHEHPCPSTGSQTGACPGWIKDHKWPLCAGGADAPWNLQWQTVAEAKVKDRWERKICAKTPPPATHP